MCYIVKYIIYPYFCSILLYSKVGEPAVVQEATRTWLRCSSNCKTSGFRTVTELYLLHVLVPLEHFEEARELVVGEVGCGVFTEDQRRIALDVVEEKSRQAEESSLNPRNTSDSAGNPASSHGLVFLLSSLHALTCISYR